ncbi:MAG: ABC transporter permease subunit [Thermoanaerobaculia bacterium]|nr:ABC transporter permease subunit [Thermoanaerobaculia bacterium]
MAVFDQGYRVYRGALTPAAGRFLILARYALRVAVKSRRTLVFLVLSGMVPLIAAIIIYLHHNAEAIAILRIPIAEILPIDGKFFLWLLRGQGIAAFMVFLSAGSTLISADLRDNALPLYLSRPISRGEYVLGKLVVLLILGSAVTWVPLLLLFSLQTSLQGFSWAFDHLRWGVGLFVGSWVLMILLGLVGLAISAALRAKAAAEAVFAGFFLLTPLLGKVIDETLRTDWGVLLNFVAVLDSIWLGLFGLKASSDVSAMTAWCVVIAFGLMAAWVLHRRIRAYEVVG